MKTLAIETSDKVGSIAAYNGANLLAESQLAEDRRSAQSLAPAIARILQQVEWNPQVVQLIAVTIGPGSFTGLRVGVTTAKAFAYAVGCEVLGVHTLDVIADSIQHDKLYQKNNATGVKTNVLDAVIDAQRQQVFAKRYLRDMKNNWCCDSETVILDNDQWIAQLKTGQSVVGPALKKLADRIPSNIIIADESLWTPQAAPLGRLAQQRYESGSRDDFWQLVPHYYRKSAAEEKLEAED